MDEQYIEFCKVYSKFVKDFDFIFDNKAKAIMDFNLYISHFCKEKDVMDFFLYSPHAHYLTDILFQYKDKFIYTTNLISHDGSRMLNSVVQLSPETHLVIRYPYNDGKIYCLFDIYTKNSQFYLDFLANNEKFEFREIETSPVGFVPR